MGEPRDFRVAIVGKGPLRKIALGTVDMADFVTAVSTAFCFTPGELDRLELRRVEEEPNDENADELFTASPRKVNSTAGLVPGDVQYIVGKVVAPAGKWFRRAPSELAA